jgi:hypothetical protein
MLSPRFVRIHKLSISILIFLSLMMLIHWWKPKMIYDEHGGFRSFGIGYQQTTVFPIWLVSIVLAIFSYLFVMYLQLIR